MPYTLAINPMTNDLFINRQGKIQTTYGAQEVKQRVLIALKHYYEEYFLNIPAGVPWFEFILGTKNTRLAEAVLRKIVLSVPNVISIMEWQSNFAGRNLSLSMVLQVNGVGGPDVVSIYDFMVRSNHQ